MAIPKITSLPTPPSRFTDSQEDFVNKAEDLFDALHNVTVNEMNTSFDAIDATALDVTNKATIATEQADIATTQAEIATEQSLLAQAAVNYKGEWVAGYNTTGYSLGMSVSFTDGYNYVSKINNNLVSPTSQTNTAEWNFIEALSPADLVLKADKANPTFTGLITEQVSVSTLTLGDTSSVQTYTATADFTIVDDLVSGESVTLILTNGGFTPTYPTITWWDKADGTTEPTLGTTDKIKFEKVGATLYGSHIGSIS